MVAGLEGRDQMFYVKEGGLPWHKMGVGVDDAPTAIQAAKIAGIDWLAVKRPIHIKLEDGSYKEIPDRFATVRLLDDEVLGIVSRDYRILQYTEALDLLDGAVRDLGIELHYETAGSLFNGKQMFAAARLPGELRIGKGEKQLPYLMIRTGHDGNTGIDALPTAVRPVCFNTVTLALNERRRHGSDYAGITLMHVGSMADKIAAIKGALKLSITKLDEYELVSAKLAEIPTTPSMVDIFVRLLFPVISLAPEGRETPVLLDRPEKAGLETLPFKTLAVPGDEIQKRIQKREEKVDIFKTVLSEEDGSAWGLFNAATGYQDHRKPYLRVKGERAQTGKLWGAGAAFKADALKGIRLLTGV